MNLNALWGQLRGLSADLPLTFTTDLGPITGGYHVTEFHLAKTTVIDCGGRIHFETTARVQLLDGSGGPAMVAGKLARILERCIGTVEGLGEAPLRVEVGLGNADLRLYAIDALTHDAQGATIALVGARAVCRPAQDMAIKGDGCCTGTTADACCG